MGLVRCVSGRNNSDLLMPDILSVMPRDYVFVLFTHLSNVYRLCPIFSDQKSVQFSAKYNYCTITSVNRPPELSFSGNFFTVSLAGKNLSNKTKSEIKKTLLTLRRRGQNDLFESDQNSHQTENHCYDCKVQKLNVFFIHIVMEDISILILD